MPGLMNQMFLSVSRIFSIPFRAASRLASSKARFFRSKFPLSRTSVWRKINGVVGWLSPDAPDEPFQPLVDLLGRRVRKGVEQKGVGPGLRGDAREECIELALPAGPEVDEPESQGAAQACGVGHSRTASRSAVRDARPDHHNPVAEGVGSGFQQRTFVGSDFEGGDLVVQREVEQALLHRRIHVFDDGGFVLRSGFARHTDSGEDPFAVAANVEVEPRAGR